MTNHEPLASTFSRVDAGTRRTWLRTAAVIATLGLYLGCVSPHWIIDRDSALYLLLGQSLARGEGYALDGRPHGMVPPGYPAWLAAPDCVGLTGMLWKNLAMVAAGLGSLGFCYAALREVGTERRAFWLTFVMAWTHTLLRYSVTQVSDVPFMLIITAGLWAMLRGLRTGGGWFEFGALCLVASCWFRLIGAALVCGAALGLLFQPGVITWRRRLPVSAAMFAGVGLTAWCFIQWSAYVASADAVRMASYQDYYGARLSQLAAWEIAAQPFLNFVQTTPELCYLWTSQAIPDWLGALLFWTPILVGGTRMWRRQPLVVTATAAYITGILLVSLAYRRYLLPVAPWLLWMSVEGWAFRITKWRDWRSSFAPVPQSPAWFAAMACVMGACLVCNVPKNFKLLAQLRSRHFLEQRSGHAAQIETAEFLRRTARPGDRLIGSREYIFSYLSGIPSAQVAQSEVMRKPGVEGVADLLAAQRATLIVTAHDQQYPLFEGLREAAGVHTGFRRLFDNGTYTVYRWQPEDVARKP